MVGEGVLAGHNYLYLTLSKHQPLLCACAARLRGGRGHLRGGWVEGDYRNCGTEVQVGLADVAADKG